MSPRFWVIAAGFMLTGLVAGVSLGGFATSSGRVGFRDSGWADTEAATDHTDGSAPGQVLMEQATTAPMSIEPIVCKGCGPTLAERQMAADAYDVGGVDPYLRDYGRTDLDEPVIPVEVVRTRPDPGLTPDITSDAPTPAVAALPPPRPVALSVQ